MSRSRALTTLTAVVIDVWAGEAVITTDLTREFLKDEALVLIRQNVDGGHRNV